MTLPCAWQMIWAIIGVNTGVWMLWKVPLPAVQQVCYNWFLTSARHSAAGFRGLATNLTAT
jgi:hypothetical protein